MKNFKNQRPTQRYVHLENKYRLYEQSKKNPDPRISYEAWVKRLAKELKI